MLKIQTFVNRPIDENTYVVSEAVGIAPQAEEGGVRPCIIVDCGALHPADWTAIGDYIAREGLSPVAHLLTHGHFDHMFGAQWVVETYGLHAMIHAADRAIYESATAAASALFHRPMVFDVPQLGGFYDEQSTFALGSHKLSVIHCPGHTPGGCCFYCKEEGVLFSGDSIFRGGIGRTDLPGGNHAALMESLSKLAATLPEEVTIYPGHGPKTNVGEETAAYKSNFLKLKLKV